MTLDEYFSTGPARERPIFDAVLAALDDVEPVHVEPVSVGIFLKRAGSFAQLRPMQQWVALSLSLRRVVSHPTMTRRVQLWAGRHYHVFNLRGPEDVDDEIRAWLVEAWLDAPD
jgi:hypothetical protein